MEHHPLDLDDLRAFFLVAETGSFARAAQRLQSSKSIVSRRVARLEQTLQALLLQRTARGTHLTEAGQRYYEQARAALTQLECAAETLSDAVTDLAGPIRITAPVTFGMRYLAPAFAEFVTLYPKIEMDARFEDVTVDLAGEGFDLGIRLGDLENSSLLVRLLGESRRMVVTSPAYLERHGPITRADDLTDCAILHYSSRRTIDIWRYRTSHGDGVVKVRPYQVANNTAQLMAWVKAGLGVTLMPVYVTEAMVRTGEAVPVLDHCDWGVTRVSALMPQGRGTPRRVRTLVDFLAARFKEGFAA